MSRPSQRIGVAVAAGVYVVGFMASLYLFVANASAAGREVAFTDFSLAAGFFCLPLAGGVIAWRQPGNTTGRLLLGIGLGTVVAVLGSGWAAYSLRAHPGSLPGGAIGAWLASWALVAGFGLAPWFFATFPSGEIESTWLRRASPLAAGALVVAVLSQALAPGPIDGIEAAFDPIDNPLGVEALKGALGVTTGFAALYLVGFLVAAIVDLVVRYRRSAGERRLQMRWMAIATPVLPITMGVGIAVGDSAAGDTVLAVGQPIFLVGTAAGVAVAVLKHRLYDLDLFVRRSLVFAALTALVLGGYLAVVAAAGALLADRAGAIPPLLAVGVVAVAFQPVRARLQRAVDRLTYGRRAEPYAVLSTLGQQIEVAVAPDDVLHTIVGTIRDALRLDFAVLEAGGQVLARAGTASPMTAERFAVVFQGEPVAELVVSQRSPNEPLTGAERRLLTDLARQAGPAVHARALTAALQRSREELVASREEDRRRIRRDLHDGLGPTLAGLLLRLDVAADYVGTDPAKAAADLRALKAQLQAATDDVRRLVHDLRPPALDELGLVPAIRAQADALSRPDSESGLVVVVDAPDRTPPLPAAVEVALLRVAGEALTNVVRHANARRCCIRLRFDDVALLEVDDDGAGMNGTTAGIGLRSMRERASELGGTIDITSGPGQGTVVRLTIPLGDP